MKINAFRRFFREDYQDVPGGSWFDTLLGNINKFTDPVITSLRNQLNFADNFRCDTKTLSFTSGKELQVGTSFNSPPIGMQVLLVDGTMLLGWQMRSINTGIVGITLKLADTTKPYSATVLIFQ
jgi:hypothetical protein